MHNKRMNEHVMGQVIDVVTHPVVRIEECLRIPPRALDCVRMGERRTRSKPS
jgi:hypothetical protein